MRLTSRVSYFLATSTNLIEILGSSNRGTVLIRAWMSSISVRMGLIIAESQVQLEDQGKRYLSTMVKTAEVIKRRCWRKYDARAGGEEIADTGISLNCSPA